MGTIRGTLMQTEKIINQRVEQKIDTEKDQMRRMEQRIAFLENELQVIFFLTAYSHFPKVER